MNAAAKSLIHVVAMTMFATSLLGNPQRADAEPQLVSFLGGAAIALGMHESGHLVFDVAFGASPGVRKVSFGPLPFFAITHDPLPRGREFTVSSAGFWVQHLTSEIILTRMPDLRAKRAPLVKGMLAFNVLASVAYAGAAFARVGPLERDTRGMALSADVPEPVIGVFVLGPAVLDASRYFHPQDPWLKWTSRAAKVAGVLLIARAAD
jgi:hypothetical protein